MRYGTFILALGALWSSQVSAGELQSVYVAPGGVYIASAHVHVGTENGYPAYGAPGAAYYAPIIYHPLMHRVMCRRGRYTEHLPSMKDIDRRTRRSQPMLTGQSTPTLMRKNFHRDRPPPCHTMAVRVV